MAFTYVPFTTDRDRLRFHLGDTDSGVAKFQDEELDAIIIEAGGWQAGVIWCIRSLLAKMQGPDFRADWIQVSQLEAARKAYERLLKDKQAEFGLGNIEAGAVHVYRVDSQQRTEPDYLPRGDDPYVDPDWPLW